MRKRKFSIGLVLLILSALFGAYLSQIWQPRTWEGTIDTGTVKRVDTNIATGCLIIESKNERSNDQYTPFNLPSQFKKEGTLIWFVARPARGVFCGVCLIGEPLELLLLRKVHDPATSLFLTPAGKMFLTGIACFLISLIAICLLTWLYDQKQRK